MSQLMQAEILFLDPNDVAPGIAALLVEGFNVERLDWVDPYGPTVWVMARIDSDRIPDDCNLFPPEPPDRFFEWVVNIIAPLNGDVVEAGFAHPPQAA